MLAFGSEVEVDDLVENEVRTMLAKLQVAKGDFIATVEHLEQNFGNVQAANDPEQKRIESNLRNDMRSVFDQVKHSTEVYSGTSRVVSFHLGRR